MLAQILHVYVGMQNAKNKGTNLRNDITQLLSRMFMGCTVYDADGYWYNTDADCLDVEPACKFEVIAHPDAAIKFKEAVTQIADLAGASGENTILSVTSTQNGINQDLVPCPKYTCVEVNCTIFDDETCPDRAGSYNTVVRFRTDDKEVNMSELYRAAKRVAVLDACHDPEVHCGCMEGYESSGDGYTTYLRINDTSEVPYVPGADDTIDVEVPEDVNQSE